MSPIIPYYIIETTNNKNNNTVERITFKLNDTIQVFRYGKSLNAKISNGKENIMQSFTYSVEQFKYVENNVRNGVSNSMSEFFSMDKANCMDCPFSSNSGNGKCYTHKFGQFRGFISQIKSVIKEFGSTDSIPVYNESVINDIVKLSKGNYVRFASYGEPTMHPAELVSAMSDVAKQWTGYTHQYFRKPEYANWFMASAHTRNESEKAFDDFGYRSFMAIDSVIASKDFVNCPASKEMKYKSNCEKCGLCSGIKGKGKKNVVIVEH